MNPRNVEIFSLIIIFFTTLDYISKFGRKLNRNSINFLLLSVSITVLCALNIAIFYTSDINKQNILLWIGYMVAIIPMLLSCYYINVNYFDYVDYDRSLNKVLAFYAFYLLVVNYAFYNGNIATNNLQFITQAPQYRYLIHMYWIPLCYVYVKSFVNFRHFDRKMYTTLGVLFLGILAEMFILGDMYLIIGYAITALLLALNKFTDTMNKDALTGIYNRRYFENFVFSPGETYGIFLTDMDNFKEINDKYGHDMGDKILKDVSQILIDASRATDNVIRLGGDEFVIIAKLKSKEGLVKIENRIERELMDYNSKNDIEISFSTGCEIYTTNDDYKEMFRKVDEKMYQRKSCKKKAKKIKTRKL